jgi:hypothetical protein
MTFQFSNPIWLLALPPAVPWGPVAVLEIGRANWRGAALDGAGVAAAGGAGAVPGHGGFAMAQAAGGHDGLLHAGPLAKHSFAAAGRGAGFRQPIFKAKKANDTAGVLVFGADAAIETRPNSQIDLRQVQAVVGVERTDIASAIRLGTAAFPETGQKRLVLLSDGNENVGDAMSALAAALPLGVSWTWCRWAPAAATMSPSEN